ncbi:hypothetical protein D3C80_981290 [compost metagenome]
MPTITKPMYVCLCVAEGKDGGTKRGVVSVESFNYASIWSVDEHIRKGGESAAYVLLRQIDVEIDYELPTAEEQAAISLPLMEAGLQKLRADFVVQETKFLADIASIKQLTYKGPIEGDFMAAADAARDVSPARHEDVEDAEIVDAPKFDDGIPF